MRFACCLTLGFVTLLCGCGGGVTDQPNLGRVTGVITLDDEPLSGAVVVFTPESGRSSMGETNEDGQYELVYIRDTKGATIGTHSVTISKQEAPAGANPNEPDAGSPAELVPARYNSATTLTAEVKAEGNEIDFPLKSNP
ncbi:hypothetical protein [Thalassoglobus sp.]|uniref:hypothetical protein n=1 Tax=Thalassoglobus sp. TaxID=2795869 RepID=UPI003AA84165